MESNNYNPSRVLCFAFFPIVHIFFRLAHGAKCSAYSGSCFYHKPSEVLSRQQYITHKSDKISKSTMMLSILRRICAHLHTIPVSVCVSNTIRVYTCTKNKSRHDYQQHLVDSGRDSQVPDKCGVERGREYVDAGHLLVILAQ
jgi:hypothetical protein